MIRLLIVDDHPMVREAVHSAVKHILPGAAVLEAASLEAACETLQARRNIDLVLLDLVLPGITGFDGLILLRSRFPSRPVMVFTALDDPEIAAASIRYGASGFLPKSASSNTLAEAVREVLNGEIYLPAELRQKIPMLETDVDGGDPGLRLKELTPGQNRVLQLVRKGLPNKLIAHELGVGISTVKAHITEILRKLGVTHRTQIVMAASSLEFETILKGKRGTASSNSGEPALPQPRSRSTSRSLGTDQSRKARIRGDSSRA